MAAPSRAPWQHHHGNGALATAPWQRGREDAEPRGPRGPSSRAGARAQPGQGLGSSRAPREASAAPSSSLSRGARRGRKEPPGAPGLGPAPPSGTIRAEKKTTKQPLPPPRLISPGLVRSCKQVHASPAALRTHVPALPVPGQLLQPVLMRLVAVAQQMRSLGPGARTAPGELPLLRQQSSGRATRPRVRTHAPRARTALPARLSSSFQPC